MILAPCSPAYLTAASSSLVETPFRLQRLATKKQTTDQTGWLSMRFSVLDLSSLWNSSLGDMEHQAIGCPLEYAIMPGAFLWFTMVFRASFLSLPLLFSHSFDESLHHMHQHDRQMLSSRKSFSMSFHLSEVKG